MGENGRGQRAQITGECSVGREKLLEEYEEAPLLSSSVRNLSTEVRVELGDPRGDCNDPTRADSG